MTIDRSAVMRRALALGTAALLVAGALPVRAGWSTSTVDDSYALTRPSLRVDSADHAGIAYQRTGDSPGIFFATNATGSWNTTRVTSGEDAAPSLRFDASKKAHVAFARLASSPGIYVTDNSLGSWSASTLVAADTDPTLPSLAIDGSGHQGIAYASSYSFEPGLFFATDATGSWVRTRITSGAWENTPALQFDGAGHAHIMFARYAPEDPGIYYATNATGSWVITHVTSAYDDSPSFVLDGSGKVHAAFRRFESGASAMLYATNATGSWVLTQLAGPEATYGPPAIAFDPSGGLHVVFPAHSPDQVRGESALGHLAFAGSWQFADSPDLYASARTDQFPSLGFKSDGTIQLAFKRAYPSAGIRFYAGVSPSSLIAGSQADSGPAITLGPSSDRDVSFGRRTGDNAATVFANGTGASWSLDAAGAGGDPALSATDIAVDGGGHVRIVDGSSYYSNATGGWTSDTTLQPSAETRVSVDGSGHTHILQSRWVDDYWWWAMNYTTDATGSWVSSSPNPSSGPRELGANPEAALALDTNGKPHIAFSFADGAGHASIAYENMVSGSWSNPIDLRSTGLNEWPSIAIDAANHVHIAYARYASNPGIYYVTNKSGSWVTTRLTKSWSDGAPSIALDGSGHVYIATTRASWAADPGIYVMTNATGSWVKAQLVSGLGLGDVSLSVTSGGLARLVFATAASIVEYENSLATLTSARPLALSKLGIAAASGRQPEISGSIGSATYGPAVPGALHEATGSTATKSVPTGRH